MYVYILRVPVCKCESVVVAEMNRCGGGFWFAGEGSMPQARLLGGKLLSLPQQVRWDGALRREAYGGDNAGERGRTRSAAKCGKRTVQA